MIESKRLVTITPVGRKKYIELLYPYLLRDSYIIDQHIFWITTEEKEDVAFAKELCSKYPSFFSMEWQRKDRIPDSKYYINDLYLTHNETNTVYVQLADDICWIDPCAIGTLAAFRIANPEYFLIYPLIINTSITTSIYQSMGIIPIYLSGYWNWQDRHNLDLKKCDGLAGHVIHESFFRKIDQGAETNLKLDKYHISYDQFVSGQSFCWLGSDIMYFANPLNVYDRDFLSCIEPKSLGKISCICGGSLMSHFSFSNQQNFLLDNTFVYNRYRDMSTKLARAIENAVLSKARNKLKGKI